MNTTPQKPEWQVRIEGEKEMISDIVEPCKDFALYKNKVIENLIPIVAQEIEKANKCRVCGDNDVVCAKGVAEQIDKAEQRVREEGITGETSDGYHTFNELYSHRTELFRVLCSSRIDSWKSKKHSDGTMFNGMFIVGIGTEKGEQITYHVDNKYWRKFDCKELENAPEWDGHSSNDVIGRLRKLLTPKD